MTCLLMLAAFRRGVPLRRRRVRNRTGGITTSSTTTASVPVGGGDDGALDAAVRLGKALSAGDLVLLAPSAPATRPRSCALGTPLLIHQPSYSMLNPWIEGGLLDVQVAGGIRADLAVELLDQVVRAGDAVEVAAANLDRGVPPPGAAARCRLDQSASGAFGAQDCQAAITLAAFDHGQVRKNRTGRRASGR